MKSRSIRFQTVNFFFQVIYNEGFTEKERSVFKEVVIANLVNSFTIIILGAEKKEYEFENQVSWRRSLTKLCLTDSGLYFLYSGFRSIYIYIYIQTHTDTQTYICIYISKFLYRHAF